MLWDKKDRCELNRYKVPNSRLFHQGRVLWGDTIWIETWRMRRGFLSKLKETSISQATEAFYQAQRLWKWKRYFPGFMLCQTHIYAEHSKTSISKLDFPLERRFQGLSNQIHHLLSKAVPSKLAGKHRDGLVWGVSLKPSIKIFSKICKKAKIDNRSMY